MLSHSIMSDSLQPLELWPQRLLCAWNSPGKNSRASCHSLLQRSSRPRLQNSKICWTQRLGWDYSKSLITNRAFLCGSAVKNLPAVQEIRFWFMGQGDPRVRKIPWGRKWQPTPVFFPGESHGQRSLEGYSPWGRKRVRHSLATKQQHYHQQKNDQRRKKGGEKKEEEKEEEK